MVRNHDSPLPTTSASSVVGWSKLGCHRSPTVDNNPPLYTPIQDMKQHACAFVTQARQKTGGNAAAKPLGSRTCSQTLKKMMHDMTHNASPLRYCSLQPIATPSHSKVLCGRHRASGPSKPHSPTQISSLCSSLNTLYVSSSRPPPTLPSRLQTHATTNNSYPKGLASTQARPAGGHMVTGGASHRRTGPPPRTCDLSPEPHTARQRLKQKKREF